MDLGNILYDRHLDSVELERRLLAALLEAPPVDLGALTDAVLATHPEKANLIGLTNQLWQVSRSTGPAAVMTALEARGAALEAGRGELVARVLEVLGGRRVVLTLSQNPCVKAALAASAGRYRVVVGEGRPLREGVTAARELAALGLEVTVVTDAVLASLPLTARELAPPLHFDAGDAVVLLGTDALLAEGFLAKSGSRALAELAALGGVELVVAGDPEQLLASRLAPRLVPRSADPVDLGAPAAVNPVHRPSDFVPWSLVTTVVVGAEILAPAEIASRTDGLVVDPELLARWSMLAS